MWVLVWPASLLEAVAVTPWVYPGFAWLGQLSQTGDRLYSCGLRTGRAVPECDGGGRKRVLIANSKLQNQMIVI